MPRFSRQRVSLFALYLALATTHCGGTTTSSDAQSNDAATDVAPTDSAAMDATSVSDAGNTLRRCPLSGTGALRGDACFVLSPAETGLPASGINALDDQYALRPTSNPRGNLLLFFNGSGGSPRGGIATPDVSFFSVARAQGLHVLAVSYRSDDPVGNLCATAADRDTCFLQTRTTIITGVYQPGAHASLVGIAPHEGIYARVTAALVTLSERDPLGGWEAFFDRTMIATPERALRWSTIYTSGHSQGGGHAALLGRLHGVARVIVLASPCDSTRGTPAAWLSNDGSFATDPTTRFFGLGAVGDPICSAYPAVWNALRMPTTAQMADAFVCAGEGAHSAPVKCAENEARWVTLLQR